MPLLLVIHPVSTGTVVARARNAGRLTLLRGAQFAAGWVVLYWHLPRTTRLEQLTLCGSFDVLFVCHLALLWCNDYTQIHYLSS
jgi:hypothetical protein